MAHRHRMWYKLLPGYNLCTSTSLESMLSLARLARLEILGFNMKSVIAVCFRLCIMIHDMGLQKKVLLI